MTGQMQCVSSSSFFKSIQFALQTKFFLDDFPRAQEVAAALDAQLSSIGYQSSLDYADLLALSTRQAMGSLDITLAKTSDGSWNTSDVKVFMKNIRV